jgi:hypothetical protein
VPSPSRFHRLIARLSGAVQLERLNAIDRKVGSFGRAQRESLAAQRQQLDQVLASLTTRAGADAVRSLDKRVEDLQRSISEQDRAVSSALERARLFDELAVDDRRFARRIEQLLGRGGPIIVGPWTGEVGFELLYWIPFVRWVVARYRIDPSRLTVVSRGGVASWYAMPDARYVDVFDSFSPEVFRRATEEARKKQRRVGAFDAQILTRVRESHRLSRAELLHPGMMYRLFNPVWKEVATPARIDAYTVFERIGAPERPPADLPTEYVAARFYFSDCFPDTPANRDFVGSTLDTISRQIPVVLLNPPFAVDDHRDFTPSGGRVISVADRMRPESNLGVQTAVIARARAFVGTYGGYSYLAPHLGVSALAFYSARTFKTHHLHLAQRVFERLGGATVVPLETAQLPLVQLATSGVALSTR